MSEALFPGGAALKPARFAGFIGKIRAIQAGRISNWVGRLAEARAIAHLSAGGEYRDVISLQNKSGNGIDLIARNRRGEVIAFEIKGHRNSGLPLLEGNQRKLQQWMAERLADAATGRGRYANLPREKIEAAKLFLRDFDSGKPLHAVVLNIEHLLPPLRRSARRPRISEWRWNPAGRPRLLPRQPLG